MTIQEAANEDFQKIDLYFLENKQEELILKRVILFKFFVCSSCSPTFTLVLLFFEALDAPRHFRGVNWFDRHALRHTLRGERLVLCAVPFLRRIV
jgi:hypothetical protein